MAKKVYFCGIGGSGMSALARYFLAEGAEVYGSDVNESDVTVALSEEGAHVFSEQSAENITAHAYDLFVYTQAIPDDHVEMEAAKAAGIEMKRYFEVLGDISKNYYTIAVSGTHGKSSTTAMLATILRDSGREVTALVGANIHGWDGKNFLRANEGASDGMPTKNYLIVEACEYRDSFLSLDPNGIVVTNVEPDHMDYFKTEEKYFESFQEFLAKLPQFGFFASFLNGENMMKILPPNFHPRKFGAEDETESVPALQVMGSFQRLNAASALAAAKAIKIDEEEAIASLENFTGLSRRFDVRGTKNGILVVDDYAHHPTALKMVIHSAREYVKTNKRKKLWVVFQPHQFSRTATFRKEFIDAFSEADEVLIPNIYASRDSESDISALDIDDFVADIEKAITKVERSRSNVWGRGTRKRGEVFYKKQVRYTKTFENTLEILDDYAYDGDVIVCVGAGDVHKISTEFLEG